VNPISVRHVAIFINIHVEGNFAVGVLEIDFSSASIVTSTICLDENRIDSVRAKRSYSDEHMFLNLPFNLFDIYVHKLSPNFVRKLYHSGTGGSTNFRINTIRLFWRSGIGIQEVVTIHRLGEREPLLIGPLDPRSYGNVVIF
jgi:hypothetical protein